MLKKLTENRTIELLMPHLTQQGYEIESFCLGQTRGYDVVAVKNGKKLLIEVKGAKAHKDSPTKRRDYFNSGQIKTPFK
jgi:Holliday junction resolvase